MAGEMNGFFGHPPAPIQAAAEVDDAEEGAGQGKLCARGHWRPAEDARLRDLVAQYGPQNWNLIAEKLDGRSGNKKKKIIQGKKKKRVDVDSSDAMPRNSFAFLGLH